jgi:hypothetical protein
LQDDRPNREMIERAEDLILRLRDIHSCRISTDETGLVSEVHVVAATERSPKMIARDVETCLKAELNLDIDYRKIGVVIIDPMKETDPAKRLRESAGETVPAGDDATDRIVEEQFAEVAGVDDKAPIDEAVATGTEPGETSAMRESAVEEELARTPVHGTRAGEGGAPRLEGGAALEFLEQDVRVRFAGLQLGIEETRVDAEVKLEKNGLEVVGCLGGFRTRGPMYETIAGATVHALTELLDERFHLCLSTVKEIEVSGSKALLAVVDVIDGREVRSFAGCVFVGRDANEAAVLAVLDALNRPSGRWKSRTEIHYRIR